MLANADDVQTFIRNHPFGQKPIGADNKHWNHYSKAVEQFRAEIVEETAEETIAEVLTSLQSTMKNPSTLTMENPSIPDKEFFNNLISPNKEITKEHVNMILRMWWKRSNQKSYAPLHRTSFVSISFLNNILTCYESFQKARSKYVFPEEIMKVVKGEQSPFGSPRGKWVEDIDVIYGLRQEIVYSKKKWYGMCFNLKKRSITLLHCDNNVSVTEKITDHVQRFAEMIPVIVSDAINQTAGIQDNTPFSVEEVSDECKPRIENAGNQGLFVLKMIECHYMGIEDMTNVCDEAATEIRKRWSTDIVTAFSNQL